MLKPTPHALLAIIAAMVLAIASHAHASPADYPTHPITLVVPYPPGGGNDVIARLVAAKMSQSLGQPIVVENRAGAGSTIGTRDVARSAPSGYALLIATSSLAINPSLYPDADYDPQKDFAPVGLIATSANLVLVRPSLPAHSIAELIALAKKAPASSISPRPAPAPARISPPHCSAPWRASSSPRFPTRAWRPPSPISSASTSI
jgi:tripartite-type tricarboxylate transporter receptor subunit TctC